MRDVAIARRQGTAQHDVVPKPLVAVVRPDLRFHYASPLGAERWLDVVRDPSYGHDALIAAAAASVPRLLGSSNGSRERRLAVVSFGPGDGALDAAMLDAFSDIATVESYTGIDSSMDLLRHAAERLQSLAESHKGISFNLIHGDFLELSQDQLPVPTAGARSLFMLLGLTFGNYSESGLLRGLTSLMRDDGVLLFDARVHAFGADADESMLTSQQREALLATYDRVESRRFAFAPVEALTTATIESCPIRFEISRRYSEVPGALTIVTYCEPLDTVMRETQEPVHQARLDLGVTSAYDAASLLAWLPSQGVEVVTSEVAAGTMRVLARRAAT